MKLIETYLALWAVWFIMIFCTVLYSQRKELKGEALFHTAIKWGVKVGGFLAMFFSLLLFLQDFYLTDSYLPKMNHDLPGLEIAKCKPSLFSNEINCIVRAYSRVEPKNITWLGFTKEKLKIEEKHPEFPSLNPGEKAKLKISYSEKPDSIQLEYSPNAEDFR